jgi:hypothetical protein
MRRRGSVVILVFTRKFLLIFLFFCLEKKYTQCFEPDVKIANTTFQVKIFPTFFVTEKYIFKTRFVRLVLFFTFCHFLCFTKTFQNSVWNVKQQNVKSKTKKKSFFQKNFLKRDTYHRKYDEFFVFFVDLVSWWRCLANCLNLRKLTTQN